ncbi:hypothetical protein SDC9_177846 [bioreactor metagenome]|uniref:Uncharacterized protein n=1 Tax=bioreactor metagenome TaxID=1076179 RepID=A0A645GUC3_9ZZZZ
MLVVFNDAVVYNRDGLSGIRMRMRVDIRRFAVCCPAGVSNAGFAAHGGLFEQIFQVFDFALCLAEG